MNILDAVLSFGAKKFTICMYWIKMLHWYPGSDSWVLVNTQVIGVVPSLRVRELTLKHILFIPDIEEASKYLQKVSCCEEKY
jgi:hypothetical protein